MSALRAVASYSSPGFQRDVLVVRDPAGRWQVVDSDGERLTLVETLTGHDDRLDQAIALARDYAAQQQAYHDGRRDGDPLPRSSTRDEARRTA